MPTEPDDLPYGKGHADAAFDASLARAQLAQAKANVCSCGVRRETCPSHRAQEPEEAGNE